LGQHLAMKGSRAKKAAEAAEGSGAVAGELEPTPPSGAPEKGPRPGPVVQGSELVQISAAKFAEIIGQIRSNELLGAAAADTLEAAASLRPLEPLSPQSKGAKELRGKVANSREGGMKFDAGPVEEIPDEVPASKRASLTRVADDDASGHDMEAMENHCEKDAPEPPELNLSQKQNGMRTDLEMWCMDEIPALYGVDDSEELPEILQEDGQADSITFLIAETDQDKQNALLLKWLSAQAADEHTLAEFTKAVLEKVRAIQEMSPKKKKKKKKDA